MLYYTVLFSKATDKVFNRFYRAMLVTEMIQATGDTGTQWILDLCNGIVKEGSIPDDRKSSVVLPIYKGKGDPMECGSYRGIKLLEHAMKVVERIFERRIRQQIKIDDMQFGFMKGKGTTDAIFMARQMQENFRVKGRKLYFGFVDLEKAFDRVPREVISWAMRKLGVEEWLVSAVMSMYTVSQKKDTKLLPITSPNVNRFSKFFHWQTHW